MFLMCSCVRPYHGDPHQPGCWLAAYDTPTPAPTPRPRPRCECGAAATYGPDATHSDWCPATVTAGGRRV